MADTILRLIPADPMYIPDTARCVTVRQLLDIPFPDADEITVRILPRIEFVDAGSNSGQVVCPICRASLDTNWWQWAMNHACQMQFTDLSITLPCCGAANSLSDLVYDWPAGFARFLMEVRNPTDLLSADHLAEIEQVLGCSLRVIWARY